MDPNDLGDISADELLSSFTPSLTNDQYENNVLNIIQSDNIQKIQENTNCTISLINQQQVELINSDRLSMNSTSFDMDLYDTDKGSQQISLNTDMTINDEQNFDSTNTTNDTSQNYQILQTLTTGEQQITAYDYCCQMLEKLTLAVNTLKPILVDLAIPSATGDSYLKTFGIPSPHDVNITTQEPLKILSNLFQMTINTLPSFRQKDNTNDCNNTIPIGQELNETSEKTIAAPSEQNGCHLNQEIQAVIQSNFLTSSIPKDIFPIISLSELLSQAQKCIQEIKLVELKISEQPQEFWKKRSINCLKNKWCPAIQGRSGKQRRYIGIKWSKLINYNPNDLFIFVQLLSYNNQSHSSKVLVPPETIVQKLKLLGKKQKNGSRRLILSDLIIKDIYGFDKKNNAILCPITEDEYHQCKKNLKVLMFNLYKTSEEIDNSNDNNEIDKDEDNEISEYEDEDTSIENQLHKLCKLRICLCRRTDKNKLEFISNFVDTDMIEESKGNKALAINSSKVTPKQLCKCGNEIITIPLNTDSEKNGFIVHLNETKLKSSEIHGVKDKQIFFNSIPYIQCKEGSLHVVVSKKSILKTIQQHHNPYDGLDENILLDCSISYVDISDNLHDHKMIDTKLSMQTNEINRKDK
ncbi:unnamed protein product [Rotaria sordida]|uniref:Uncharacterized protein n=1 Tax=Rotaria sordida TaxID=392033 RepID=A0A815GPS6_9BILA|nr:unnamed protein product [Rotaria sordida]